MVSTLSLVAMVFTLLVIFAAPIGLVIWLGVRHKASLLAVLVGAVVFLVSQLLVRIPLLNAFSTTEMYPGLLALPLLFALFLALTAGLFEEGGRWLGFRYLLRRHWQVKDGVAFGLGHGGFEAMALVGLTYINNLFASLSINAGQFEAAFGPLLGAEAAAAAREQLVSAAPLFFATAGFERALSIIIHIAFSLVVLQGVRSGRPIYLLYAILLHGLANLPAGLAMAYGWDTTFLNVFLSITALISLVYILRQWKAGETSTGQPARMNAGEVASTAP
jgi:uncharacterized membrane protein YhfC